MKKEILKYNNIISIAKQQINDAKKKIRKIKLMCPHKNLKHFNQIYIGKWSVCEDCGEEDI